MNRRFQGVVQSGYGVGAQVMADPELWARMAHHFATFSPVPGTLNVRLPERFDPALFTGRVTAWELGDIGIEDHPYASVLIEGSIPGLVVQTSTPGDDFPAEVVELIADRHLRTSLGLRDGDTIAFELVP